ncbi:P-loop containing nucleoside triphosphate hydrolase [Sesbania bispinosa]|nr:P-loop containing nucleoside triphosphate hydrolase [Sesbania bispinosa]
MEGKTQTGCRVSRKRKNRGEPGLYKKRKFAGIGEFSRIWISQVFEKFSASSDEVYNFEDKLSPEECVAVYELSQKMGLRVEKDGPYMSKADVIKKLEDLATRMKNSSDLKLITEQRSKLPIASFKDVITSTVESHQVAIICGETGCGKTTQVPQYILDHMWGKGEVCKIVCTQPRCISATSVSERIARERGETIGNNVGYKDEIHERDHTQISCWQSSGWDEIKRMRDRLLASPFSMILQSLGSYLCIQWFHPSSKRQLPARFQVPEIKRMPIEELCLQVLTESVKEDKLPIHAKWESLGLSCKFGATFMVGCGEHKERPMTLSDAMLSMANGGSRQKAKIPIKYGGSHCGLWQQQGGHN